MEEGGFFCGGGREEGGLGGEEGGVGAGEACWVLGGGSVVFVVVVVVVGGRHDGGMVYRLNRIEWIYRAKSFFSFFCFVGFSSAGVSTATTTMRFSDGCSKILSCPSPFSFLRDGKIEQYERV